MQMMMEAGFTSFLSLAVFVAGVACVAVKRGRAEPFAVAIVAIGLLGHGLGVRLVSGAAEAAPSLPEKVALLQVGSAEAAAAGVIAGGFALCLLVLSAAATALRGEKA